MANRNLQVNLSFKADTSAALKNLETLRSSLNSISSMPFQGGKVITADIRQAAAAAEQLQHHLGMAMDVKTGNLNLNKLQASLASSNTSLASLTGNLLKAGTTGQQAFLATHRAISNANLQLTKSNTLLSQFTTTLFSAAKWQAAYGAINMVTQSMGKAVDYAKELDKSLNNISIVTGYSAEKMATFAKQANESAKALNTTTTKYTDASLIYFQQGLGDKEVKERTDITVKLANVVGESAEQVSEWTTAIWNNFAKGGESLESYADKLAALGAATASSADEIAEGLEKFSAIAETVGLSYDYAASALATVTAETRQSAEVVGTAFKTLFARMEGLKLGDTLEDGTTLNQYSKALESVGISIKSANGELKDMDNILNEMGIRWQTLSKDQQVALAQSVGGMRQYNQLIALMDNWDKFQTNLQTAQDAEGTLSSQAETYAQSWEAAKANVKTSMEEMYSILVPEDGFKDFLNGLADIVEGFNGVLKAAGGLPTILGLISTMMVSKFQPQISSFLDSTFIKINNIQKSIQEKGFGKSLGGVIAKGFHGLTGGAFQNSQKKFDQDLQKGEGSGRSLGVLQSQEDAINNSNVSETFKEEVRMQKELTEYSLRLKNVSQYLTAGDQERIQSQIKQLQLLQEQTAELMRQKDAQENMLKSIQDFPFDADIFEPKLEEDIIDEEAGNFVADTGARKDSTVRGIEDLLNGLGFKEKFKLDDSIGYTKEEKEEAEQRKENSKKTIVEEEKKIQAAQGEKTAAEGKAKEALEIIRSIVGDKNVRTTDSGELSITKMPKNLYTGDKTKLEEAKAQYSNAQRIIASQSQVVTTAESTKAKAQQEMIDADEIIDSTGNRGMLTVNADNHSMMLAKVIENLKELEILAGEVEDWFGKWPEDIAKAAKELDEAEQTLADIEAKEAELDDGEELSENNKMKKAAAEEKVKTITASASPEVFQAKEERKKIRGKIDGSQLTGTQKESLKIAKSSQEFSKNLRTQEGLIRKVTKGLGVSDKGWNKILGTTKKIVKSIRDIKTKNKEADSSSKGINESFQTVKKSLSSIGSGIGKMTQGLSQTFSAVSMLKGAFASFKDNPFESITTSLMAMPMLVAGIKSGIGGLIPLFGALTMAIAANNIVRNAGNIATKLTNTLAKEETLEKQKEIALDQAKLILNKLKLNDEQKEAQLKQLNTDLTNKDTAADIANTVAQWAKNAAEAASPMGWLAIVAAILIGILLAGVAVILIWTSVMAAKNKAIQESNQKTMENAKANMDLIDSTQEASNSIQELTESYNDLTVAGEDTYEVVQQIIEQLPELIDKYSELEDSLGSEGLFSTGRLQELSRLLEEGKGNTQEILNEISDINEENDKKMLAINKEEAKKGYQASLSNLRVALGASDSIIYERNLGGFGDESKEVAILQKHLDKEFIESTTENDVSISFNAVDDPTVMLKYYEQLKQAAKEIRADLGDAAADSGILEEVEDELEIMKDAYEEAKAFADEYSKAVKESFHAVENKKYKDTIFKDSTLSLETYSKKRQELIDKIKQDNVDLTDDQIEKMLAADKIFGDFEAGYKNFEEGGRYREMIDKTKLSLEEVKKYWDGLSEEDKSFFATVKFTTDMNSIEDIQEQIDKQKERAKISQVEQQAIKLDISVDSLETYSDILQDNNKHLTNNELLSKKVALAQMRLNKGLTELVDSWDDLSKTLAKSERNTMEYAEAIGQLKQSFEAMFGYKPTTDFIETHLEEIQKLVKGDTEALHGLQKDLAEDYILNLDYRSSLDENNGFSSGEIQRTLKALIDDLDTSIEFGKGSTISGEYLDSLSQMAKYGQITRDEIEKALSLAGFEFDPMSISWEKAPGPKTTTYQSVYKSQNGEFGDIPDEYIKFETEEEIEYPVFNGQDSVTLTGATSAGVTRSVSSGSISSLNSKKTSDKDKKKYDDEIERYHEITQAIEDLQREMDALSEAKDRAWGPDKLAYMDAEIEKTKEMISANEEYLRQIKNKFQGDRSAVLGIGAKLDEQGRIVNYEELKKHYIDQMNKNLGNEDAEADYERIMKIIDQYEETLNTMEEQQQEIINLQNELKDKSLEKIEYKVDFQIEISEDEMAYLDYLIEETGDDLDKLGDKVGYLGKQFAELEKQSQIYRNGIKEVFGESFGEEILNMSSEEISSMLQSNTLTEAQVEALRNWRDSLIEINQSITEQIETMNETISTAFEAMADGFGEAQEKLERINTAMESYSNIVDIVGKKTLGLSNEAIRQMSEAKLETANAMLVTAKAQMDATQEAYDLVKQQYEKDPEMFKNAMKEAETALTEASENFYGQWENALQMAADAFKQNVELIAEEFDKSVSGIYSSLEDMQTAFDRQSEIGDLYFQNYKKVYEISKLNRKIAQDIEKTDNIKAQRELNSLMAEVNEYNKDGVQMSEYDLGYLEKKYALLQAQIALEEAQNTKNQMTLQRDAEGNWGYVYTANQDKIAGAQQAFEDAKYELEDYKYSSEKELQKQYLDYVSQYKEELIALAEQYDTESEEYKQKAEELANHYKELTGFTLAELNDFVERGIDLYDTFGINTVKTYEDTVLGQMNTAYSSFSQMHDGVSLAITGSAEKVANAHTDLRNTIDTAMELAGTDITEFKKDYEEMAKTAKDESKKIAKEIANPGGLKDKMCKAFDDMMKKVDEWYTKYGSTAQSLKTTNEQIISSVNLVTQAYVALERQIISTNNTSSSFSGSGSLGGLNTGDTGSDNIKNKTGGSSVSLASLLDADKLKESSDATLKAMSAQINSAKLNKTEKGNYGYTWDGRAAKDASYNASLGSLTNYFNEDTKKAWEAYKSKNNISGNGSNAQVSAFLIEQGLNIESYSTSQTAATSNKTNKNEENLYTKKNISVSQLTDYRESTVEDNTDGNGTINRYKRSSKFDANGLPIFTKDGTINPSPSDWKQAIIHGYYLGSTDGHRVILMQDGQGEFIWTSFNNGFKDIYHGHAWASSWDNFVSEMKSHNVSVYGDYSKGIAYKKKEQFDTGGYTGEWGPEGRLAVLHQKEIVLNASDTENLLRTIDMVRSFNDRIEQSAKFAALGLSNIGGITSRIQGGDTLQQEVTIHAEFPNVTDHNEIELALGNLVNDASQYANRK